MPIRGREGMFGRMRPLLLAAVLGLGLVAVAQAAGERRERTRPEVGADSTGLQVPPGPAPVPGFADSITNILSAPSPPGAPPRPPEPPTPAGPVRRKTMAYDLVRAGQNVFIGEDEVVRGDVIVLGGDLRAEGAIQGSAVVVGGNIELGSEARVDGEVVALAGRVERESGAQVRGGVVGLSLFPRPLAGGVDWRRARDLGTLVGNLIGAALVLVWTLFVALVAGRRLARSRTWLDVAPWRTTALGVVAVTGGLFAIVMGVVLLAITLVGLPLSLLVAVFTVVMLLVAQAIGLVHFGGWVCGLLRLQVRSTLMLGMIGVVIVAAPQVIADLLRLSQRAAVTQLQVLHVLLVSGTLAAGLGALVLSRLGRSPAPPGTAPVAPGFAPPAGAAPVVQARS